MEVGAFPIRQPITVKQAGDKNLIGFTIYEEIGIGIVNPRAFCPQGRVWIEDERPAKHFGMPQQPVL